MTWHFLFNLKWNNFCISDKSWANWSTHHLYFVMCAVLGFSWTLGWGQLWAYDQCVQCFQLASWWYLIFSFFIIILLHGFRLIIVYLCVYLCYQRAFLKRPQELRTINVAREGLLLKVWNKWHQQSLNTAINGMTFFCWPWGRRRCESPGSHPHTVGPFAFRMKV